MNHQVLGVVCGIVVLARAGYGEQPGERADHRASLRGALQTLSNESGDPLFRLHFRSIIEVIEASDRRSSRDTKDIKKLWETFRDVSAPNSPTLRESYLNRSRQLIISWVSPTDGQVSFTWLRLPAGWDPEREYPLYVQLHGLWDVAADRIKYLNYPFLNPGTSSAFEDGYVISPWGRGNQWYRGIAEKDFWECIAAIKNLVRVDASRQYLCGHSMGGYGAWRIARSSADTWAALGIHAGALRHDGQRELNAAAAAALRDVPTYFVVGNSDSLFGVDLVAYRLLREAGNPNLAFVAFPGGHDYRQEDVERMYSWMRKFDRGGRPAAPRE
jgi:predicted esterase